MTSKWAMGKLSDVASWKSGGTPRSGAKEFYENGTHPWAVIKDVKNGDLWDTQTSITDAALGPAKGLAPVGSVLITMYGSIGRSAIARVPVATNQAILWGVPKDGFLPEYIACWIQANEAKIDQMGRGATQRNINGAMVKDYPIPMMPLAEQRRIVDLIGTLDEAIEAAEETLDSSIVFRKEYLSSVFDGQRSAAPFHTVMKLQRGYDLPVSARNEGSVPIIASSSIVGSHDQFQVVGPGVITGRSGTIGEVHFTEENFWPLNTTLYVKDFKGNLPKFCALVLESMNLSSYAAGSTVPSLNRNVLDKVKVYCPPHEEQKIIIEFSDALDAVVKGLKSKADSLRALRTELLTALLSGDHEIPESYDAVMEPVAI